MQQVQEKQTKVLTNHSTPNIGQNTSYRPSPLPIVLATTAKVCYGLSAASLVGSIAAWNRLSMPFANKKAQQRAKQTAKPNERQYHESQRLGTYVGLLTPTFAVVGKILDDASERLAQHDFARWEKQRSEKGQSAAFRARFFSR